MQTEELHSIFPLCYLTELGLYRKYEHEQTPTSLKPPVNQSIQFEAATSLLTLLLWGQRAYII